LMVVSGAIFVILSRMEGRGFLYLLYL